MRDDIEDLTGSELLDEDDHEVVDAVIFWWRDGDGDLVDTLVDSLTTLTEGGVVWVLTPKSGRHGYVSPSDIQDAAPTAGLHCTTSAGVSKDWSATRLVHAGRTSDATGQPSHRPDLAGVPAVGQPAPDFELANQFGEPVRLSDFRGRNVVVVFYPFAFSGICTGELCEIRDNLAMFEYTDAAVLAVSVDSKFALRAYAEQEGYGFDLLADFWPHGAVAREFGVFDDGKRHGAARHVHHRRRRNRPLCRRESARPGPRPRRIPAALAELARALSATMSSGGPASA